VGSGQVNFVGQNNLTTSGARQDLVRPGPIVNRAVTQRLQCVPGQITGIHGIPIKDGNSHKLPSMLSA
jgi:hypothetical protein